MSMVYKLGDGPINYDWNIRYLKIDATEIFYSPSPDDNDGKTVNIYEGAVSNICKIKGKSFAICINLPPPTNKSLFFATETYDEAVLLRNKFLKATLNNLELEENFENINIINNVKINNNLNTKQKTLRKQSSSINLNHNINQDFLIKLEQLKNEILFNENKFTSKFKRDLKISIPNEYSKTDYLSYFKLCGIKIIKILILIYLIDFIFHNFILKTENIELGFFRKLIYNIIEIILIFFILMKVKSFSSFNPFKISDDNKCDYIVKASTIFDIDREELIKIIINPILRIEWDNFIRENKDLQIKKNSNKEENNINSFGIKITNPNNNLFSHLFNNTNKSEDYINIDMITYMDNKNNYYVGFRQKSQHNNKTNFNDSNLFELFVLIPIKDLDEEKTFVIFLTNFDGEIINKNMPYFYRQYLKEERLDILSSLKEFMKVSQVKLKNEDLEINPKKIKSENDMPKEMNNKLLYEEPYHSFSDIYSEAIMKENENSDYDLNHRSIITNGMRLTLEQRLPGYLHNPEGGVECRNYEELKTQDGIILEVMKRAGQQLLEGKNIVAVSLPVRIFEPRSTLTRITDIWGAGPFYFKKISQCLDPTERMKLLIAYAVSGMHMNLKQLKPFNPILGETYEATWPDGSRIYEEHMSHHPPVSRFLIIAGDNSWKFYGYYEYTAKLRSLTGNVIGGQFKGPNVLELSNGDVLSFNYPMINISGLMYGRRIIEWEGSMLFNDERNEISAELTFTSPPRFYQSFKEPTDIFRGEIKKGEEIVSKVFGSPVNKLLIDGEILWELETVDIIRPNEPKLCLPSDCRYRTDLIALAEGDITLAEEEKLRLEVLQRADRSARQKNSKH